MPSPDQMEAIFGGFSLGLNNYAVIAVIALIAAVITIAISHVNIYRHLQESSCKPAEPRAGHVTAASGLPGSDSEHLLQQRYGTADRARAFYSKQVLDHLSPIMSDFAARAEFLFVATADRHGECDCTSKFGEPGFIRVLSPKHVIYPEYRGNGVYANTGNMLENPHIGMLMIDFYRDTIGLHINGRARVIENDELLTQADKLPASILAEMRHEGKRRPERWVMTEVEEAYIQCSKHIPLLQKLDKAIHWGTDSATEKKGDYFKLDEHRAALAVGRERANEQR